METSKLLPLQRVQGTGTQGRQEAEERGGLGTKWPGVHLGSRPGKISQQTSKTQEQVRAGVVEGGNTHLLMHTGQSLTSLR